ncbi:MAG: 50S ribosome-binding GTPase [Desulfurococcales archaeon]|nr:50S ribosome-binding GTPase [Desulfurococcales archaeon]
MNYYRDPASVAKKIHVPLYDEVLGRIKSRYPRGGRSLFEREMSRLQAVYDIAISRTNFIRDLVRLLDGLHPFYWRLVEIEFDRSKVREAIKCVSKARKVSSMLWEKYRFRLMAAEDKRELLKISSEARGRILSPYRKCRKSFELLRSLVVFIQKLPAIDTSLPTVMVAGAPSTGKSTIVRNVSRAVPKVAQYPFTTTTIHVGHYTTGDLKIQVIDTPGLLDRDPSEMNPIERRAVAALTELDGVILYLLDPTETAYMSLERQYKLLLNVRRLVPRKPVYIAINKIDQAQRTSLDRARKIAELAVEKNLAGGYMLIKGINPADARAAIREAIKLITK